MKNKVQKAICLLLVLALMSCSHARVIGKTEKQANPLPISFQLSYQAGYVDVNHSWIGGTETMNIVEHKGKLYAGVGYWMDLPYGKAKGDDPWTGSQVLVKDSDETPWRLDGNLGESTGRAEALLSATFITDKNGKMMDKPVNMLVTSAPEALKNTLFVWTRDDQTEKWTKIKVADVPKSEGARSLGTHLDKINKVSMIFAGTSGGEIYSGVYDNTVPGHLRWESKPELVDRDGRSMAFTEANGELYCSVGRTLYKRTDGKDPTWTSVYHWSTPKPDKNYNNTIMRGLTTIPNPTGSGEVILAARENPGLIERIDPTKNHEVTVEINVAEYFSNLWDTKKRGCLMAYNDMTPFHIPGTDIVVHLIGLQMHHPDKSIDLKTGFYMVRWPDGSYTHGEVNDPSLAKHPEPRAIRCFQESPWKEGEVFTGGFDCNGRKSHNSAWMMKGTLIQPSNEKEKKYSSYEKYSNISYLKTDSDPYLTCLDIYTPDRNAKLPVLIWVHGGSWVRGHKNSVLNTRIDIPDVFCGEGYVFISINYRLTPQAIFPTHVQDVASAIAWVKENISQYGGDPARLNVSGHSAGAHLAALVATDGKYLSSCGMKLSDIKTAIPVDTEAYDIVNLAKRFGGYLPSIYSDVFTQDPEKWKEASPSFHVQKDLGIPPMLILYSGGQKAFGNPDRKTDAEDFAKILTNSSIEAVTYGAQEKTHSEIAAALSDPNDHVTITMLTFLNTRNSKPKQILIELWIGKMTALVDGKPITLDVPPMIQNGRTVVPLRFIAESINATVNYDPKEEKILINLGAITLTLQINHTEATIEETIEGKKTSKNLILESPPFIYQGRTLVPLRFISEAFGLKVEWESTEQKITIRRK
jgi:acetyl esterase/lipase